MSFNKYALTALCSVPIVFFASRYFVVKYPTLLHKKKDIGILGHQNLIGHRGSRLEGLPENSLAAFKDAAKTAHILELDVWLTKDGEVVVHHDDTLHRMTAGRVAERVTDLHLHQLPKLVPPEKQDHRVHSGEYCPDDCHCIPTLERLLESLSDDTHLIVEFKQDSDELIQKVHTLLTRFGRVQGRKDYWFSLREDLNKKLRAYDPNIPRITSVLGSARILLLHLVGLLPFLPIEEDAYGTDISHIGPNELKGKLKNIGEVPPWLFDAFLYFLRPSPLHPTGPPAVLLQHSLHQHLRSRRIPIIFQGVNCTDTLHTCIECGATAALSDNITSIGEYLAAHPELQFKKVE